MQKSNCKKCWLMQEVIANYCRLQKAIANDCRLQKVIEKCDWKKKLQMIADWKSDCKLFLKVIKKSDCKKVVSKTNHKKWLQKLLWIEILKWFWSHLPIDFRQLQINCILKSDCILQVIAHSRSWILLNLVIRYLIVWWKNHK